MRRRRHLGVVLWIALWAPLQVISGVALAGFAGASHAASFGWKDGRVAIIFGHGDDGHHHHEAPSGGPRSASGFVTDDGGHDHGDGEDHQVALSPELKLTSPRSTAYASAPTVAVMIPLTNGVVGSPPAAVTVLASLFPRDPLFPLSTIVLRI